MPKFQQLVLNLPIVPILTEHTFVETTANWEALAWINRWPDWSVRSLALCGDSGCGKSHLAHIWQQRTQAVFITPHDISYLSPDNVVQNHTCFIVDNYDQISDEKWLFHFYNLIQEKKGYLLLCGEKTPAQLEIQLPDLRSRLRTVLAISIASPDESLLDGLLTKLFQERGLETTPEINDYIIRRIERSYANVHRIIREIDTYAFATHRSLTMPLVRRVLMGDDGLAAELMTESEC